MDLCRGVVVGHLNFPLLSSRECHMEPDRGGSGLPVPLRRTRLAQQTGAQDGIVEKGNKNSNLRFFWWFRDPHRDPYGHGSKSHTVNIRFNPTTKIGSLEWVANPPTPKMGSDPKRF